MPSCTMVASSASHSRRHSAAQRMASACGPWHHRSSWRRASSACRCASAAPGVMDSVEPPLGRPPDPPLLALAPPDAREASGEAGTSVANGASASSDASVPLVRESSHSVSLCGHTPPHPPQGVKLTPRRTLAAMPTAHAHAPRWRAEARVWRWRCRPGKSALGGRASEKPPLTAGQVLAPELPPSFSVTWSCMGSAIHLATTTSRYGGRSCHSASRDDASSLNPAWGPATAAAAAADSKHSRGAGVHGPCGGPHVSCAGPAVDAEKAANLGAPAAASRQGGEALRAGFPPHLGGPGGRSRWWRRPPATSSAP